MHLFGHARLVSGGGGSDVVTSVLCPSCRPTHIVYTIVHTFGGTYADLSIDTSGVIRVIGPRPPAAADYSFLSLDGITYQT